MRIVLISFIFCLSMPAFLWGEDPEDQRLLVQTEKKVSIALGAPVELYVDQEASEPEVTMKLYLPGEEIVRYTEAGGGDPLASKDMVEMASTAYRLIQSDFPAAPPSMRVVLEEKEKRWG